MSQTLTWSAACTLGIMFSMIGPTAQAQDLARRVGIGVSACYNAPTPVVYDHTIVGGRCHNGCYTGGYGTTWALCAALNALALVFITLARPPRGRGGVVA